MKEGKFRKGVFAVVYSIDSFGDLKYAILKRKKHWKGWEFTKGKVEKFETKRHAARREASEETGLKILSVKKFRNSDKYYYEKPLNDRPGIVGQTYKLFAVRANKGDGKMKVDPKEHNGYKWASFNEAYKLLTWPNQKKCLRIIDKWLNKK